MSRMYTSNLDHRIHRFLNKHCSKFPGLTQEHIITNMLLQKDETK